MYYDAKVVKCCEIAKYKQHFYLPSAHSVSIIGSPRHPNHRPSCTSALDADEEWYRLHLLLMPKSSQTSLTRFSAESGADTRERFYRTIALLALHIPQTENKVLRTRSVGRSGGLDRRRKGKIPLFNPFLADNQPSNFFKAGKIEKNVKITLFFSVRTPMYTGFTIGWKHVKNTIFLPIGIESNTITHLM